MVTMSEKCMKMRTEEETWEVLTIMQKAFGAIAKIEWPQPDPIKPHTIVKTYYAEPNRVCLYLFYSPLSLLFPLIDIYF